MAPQETKQINKPASIGLFEEHGQHLVLQQRGTNYFHQNPKSSETAWLLNADAQGAYYYNESAGQQIRRRVLCTGRMDTTLAAHALPLYEMGINFAAGNMNSQNNLALIRTQSGNMSDVFSSGNGASVSNEIYVLQYGAQSSAGTPAQQFDNIAGRNPIMNYPNQYWENGAEPIIMNQLSNAPHYWENGHHKVDPNMGCSWNQEDVQASRSWSILLNNHFKDSASLMKYLHDTSDAPADQQMRQCSEFLSLNGEKEAQALACNFIYADYGQKIMPGSSSGSTGALHSSKYLHDTSHAPTDQQIRQCSEFLSLDQYREKESRAHNFIYSDYDQKILLGSSTGYASSSGGVLHSSKYLRAGQELLEEVCSVKSYSSHEYCSGGEAMHSKTSPSHTCRKQVAMRGEERRRLQMQKARLISILEELNRRYQRYQDERQLIVTSFESATGMGAAAAYTVLVKKFISRKFKALRDAVGEHIHVACRMLGDDISSVPVLRKGETPRLRILDQRLRHYRALQEASCMLSYHHQRWRRKHSLPERSVAVLRAWLFEHFLHPYPEDSEKCMLARITGLTKVQVANWFINARVRLWKPMVEQMYAGETKEAESQSQETSISGSSGGSKGNNVILHPLATQEHPPRHQHLVHEGCNTRTSIMTNHGVSLALALRD